MILFSALKKPNFQSSNLYEAGNQIISCVSKCFPDGTAYIILYYAAWAGCTSKPLAYYKISTGKIKTRIKMKFTLWREMPTQ